MMIPFLRVDAISMWQVSDQQFICECPSGVAGLQFRVISIGLRGALRQAKLVLSLETFHRLGQIHSVVVDCSAKRWYT
jgi:hypothetical protein